MIAITLREIEPFSKVDAVMLGHEKSMHLAVGDLLYVFLMFFWDQIEHSKWELLDHGYTENIAYVSKKFVKSSKM